jgi:NAD+ synthase
VANTCNCSEDWVGYSTKFGDSAGDFSPLSRLTVTEVKAVGRELGLPSKFIDKMPADGLSGLSDEDNLGFSYSVLDKYIREGICEDKSVKEKIDILHKNNLHKLELMPGYEVNF